METIFLESLGIVYVIIFWIPDEYYIKCFSIILAMITVGHDHDGTHVLSEKSNGNPLSCNDNCGVPNCWNVALNKEVGRQKRTKHRKTKHLLYIIAV